VLTDAGRAADCDLLGDYFVLRSAESGRYVGLAIPPALAASHRHVTASGFVHRDRPFPGGFQQFGYLMPLIRRAFLDEHNIRYDTDIWLAEDFVLYMRCLLAGARMMLLPDAYYEYRLSDASTSRADANMARNYEHLATGNARILALARNRGNRAAVVQLGRRARNIAFLRAFYGYKHAAQCRRWAEALAHLMRMLLAPVEFAQLLRLHVDRRISREEEAEQITECADQMGKEAAS